MLGFTNHNQEWISVVERLGGPIPFLSPYSPDFNPIEHVFSFIKQWLKTWREFVSACEDPIYLIVTACAQITLAKSFFEIQLIMYQTAKICNFIIT